MRADNRLWWKATPLTAGGFIIGSSRNLVEVGPVCERAVNMLAEWSGTMISPCCRNPTGHGFLALLPPVPTRTGKSQARERMRTRKARLDRAGTTDCRRGVSSSRPLCQQLFDQLVDERQQRGRNSEAPRLGGQTPEACTASTSFSFITRSYGSRLRRFDLLVPANDQYRPKGDCHFLACFNRHFVVPDGDAVVIFSISP
jgi:hypothetical protein